MELTNGGIKELNRMLTIAIILNNDNQYLPVPINLEAKQEN